MQNTLPYTFLKCGTAPAALIRSSTLVGAFDILLAEEFDKGWNCKKRGSTKKVALQFVVDGRPVSVLIKSIAQKNFSNRNNIKPYERSTYAVIALPEHGLSCVFVAVDSVPSRPFQVHRDALLEQFEGLRVKPNLVGVNPSIDSEMPALMLNSGKGCDGAHTIVAFFAHSNAHMNVTCGNAKIDNSVLKVALKELALEGRPLQPAASLTYSSGSIGDSSVSVASTDRNLMSDSSIARNEADLQTLHVMPEMKTVEMKCAPSRKRQRDESDDEHDEENEQDEEGEEHISKRLAMAPSTPVPSPVSLQEMSDSDHEDALSVADDVLSLPDSPRLEPLRFEVDSPALSGRPAIIGQDIVAPFTGNSLTPFSYDELIQPITTLLVLPPLVKASPPYNSPFNEMQLFQTDETASPFGLTPFQRAAFRHTALPALSPTSLFH